MGWVYIIHFDRKLGRAGHYCGYTSKGIRARIASHRETTWTPLPEPVRLDDGRVIAGHYCGYTSKGIRKRIAARYCPICNPNAERQYPKGETA